MARSRKAQNLRSGIPLIGGSLIDDLNALGEAAGKPGMGTRLATELNRRFNHINTRADAQAGLRGSVVVAPQKRRASRGVPEPGLLLKQNRIGDVANAIRDDEVPNWGQVRGLFTCGTFGGHVSGFAGWMEDCVDQRDMAEDVTTVGGDGICHAMWGYTYEIPNFTDTVDGDPGFSEFGLAPYWEMIVPETTTFDRVTWWRSGFTALTGALQFALYDMNQSANSFPLVVQSDAANLATIDNNAPNTLNLSERVTILPGRYAFCYMAPCFNSILGIAQNELPYLMVNSLYDLPHFGFINVTTEFPDAIDSSVTSDFDIDNAGVIPVTYWDDSQEFA